MVSTENTKIPSYLTIIEKGYEVSLKIENSATFWTATNEQIKHVARDLDTLLGIITMSEIRGKNWEATRSDLINFFLKFPELKTQK